MSTVVVPAPTPASTPVPTHRSPLLDVLRSAGGRHLFGLTLVGAVAQYGGAVAAAAAGGWVVGAAVEGRPGSQLTPGLVVLLAGFVAACAGHWTNSQCAHAFAFRHQADLRLRVFDGLDRSAPRRVLGHRTGEIASVVMADIDALEQFFAHLAPSAVAAAAVAAGATVVLASLHPLFALAFVLGAAATASVPAVLAVRAAARGEQLRHELSTLNADVVDGVRGMRELTLLRQVGSWQERIADRTRSFAAVQRSQARAEGAQRSITDLLVSSTVVVTLLSAVSLAAGGRVSLAAASLAITLVIGGLRPVVEAVGTAAAVASLRASARRVLELAEQPDLVPAAAGVAPVPADTEVVFDAVGFGYEPGPGAAVLDDVSFTVRPGEMVALVGASGAGKTTCANLLLRFWDVERGAVTIGGHDLRAYPVDELRRLVGVVPQDVHLFNGTVADNLRIGAPQATDTELEVAARAANAHDFIAELPDGYATELGENGARLSGGQRQRLAIARALVHDAPILVMDEAASNLDAENERAIHAALRAARAGRTTLVIAHRPSTIRAADRIVVLAGSRVAQEGTHDELVAAGGPYLALLGG